MIRTGKFDSSSTSWEPEYVTSEEVSQMKIFRSFRYNTAVKVLGLVIGVVLLSLLLSNQTSMARPFFSPLNPPGGGGWQRVCGDPKFVCIQGGSRRFGSLSMSLPNGFYPEGLRVYCDQVKATIPRGPTGMTLVDLPYFCGLWSSAGTVSSLLKPISVTIVYPVGYSAISLYIYNERSGWQKIPTSVDVTKNTITASLSKFYPTKGFKGWEGRSLMALFSGRAISTPYRLRTPRSAATPVRKP